MAIHSRSLTSEDSSWKTFTKLLMQVYLNADFIQIFYSFKYLDCHDAALICYHQLNPAAQ